jgi:hypothetical protein
VTLNVIALRRVDWRTVRVPNIGHFRAIFGSQEGVSGLFNRSLGLSVTVGLKEGSREQKVAEKKYWRTYSSLFQVASDEVLLAVTDFHEFAWLQKTSLRGEAWYQEFRRLYADMIIKMRKDAFEKTTLDRQVVEQRLPFSFAGSSNGQTDRK